MKVESALAFVLYSAMFVIPVTGAMLALFRRNDPFEIFLLPRLQRPVRMRMSRRNTLRRMGMMALAHEHPLPRTLQTVRPRQVLRRTVVSAKENGYRTSLRPKRQV